MWLSRINRRTPGQTSLTVSDLFRLHHSERPLAFGMAHLVSKRLADVISADTVRLGNITQTLCRIEV